MARDRCEEKTSQAVFPPRLRRTWWLGCAAAAVYGIRGHDTVARWVRHYGKFHMLRKMVRVETPDERREIARLKAHVRELESALSDAHLEARLERSYLKPACRAAGEEDVEAFKTRWDAVHESAAVAEPTMSRDSVSELCRLAGMSRQNYYARRRHRQRESVDTASWIVGRGSWGTGHGARGLRR